MATVARSTSSAVTPCRLTVRQYLRMIEAGIFPEGAHVELLGGILVDGGSKSTSENFSVGQLADEIRKMIHGVWLVREQKSVVLGRTWRPDPDISIVKGPRERYRSQAPR